nr:odorant binding protein 24 [Pagiophloeus tsushimanus]
MKVLIVICGLLMVALASDPHGIKPVHEKCQTDPESRIDESVLVDITKNHDKAVLPSNFVKHVICMSKGLGLITDEGKVSVEGVKTHVQHVVHDADKVEKIVKECAVDAATVEETSEHIWKCLYKNHIVNIHYGPGHSHENSSEESGEHHHGHH